jgi:hypothetical protein
LFITISIFNYSCASALLGTYDALKRGYTLYPLDNGIRYDDFSVLVSERELKNNFMIESGKANTALAA